jgi:prephenate dehydratase
VAARYFFGKQVEVIPCDTFRELVRVAVDKKASAGGIMAIENSIAGSILPNYNLLQKTNLKVIGEVYLSISQNLLVNPGVKLKDIKEVHSHPMALLQCMDYLEKNAWKLVETEDTALSAKHIHQHHSRHAAAVASKLAAELYELEVIAPDIQTQKNNITRFLVLQREKEAGEVRSCGQGLALFSDRSL